MKKITSTWIAALTMAVVAAAGAVASQASRPSVAGTWNMTITGPAAHGDVAATLVLAQDGTKVTGTMTAHGNEHAVAGTFSDSALALETTDTPPDKGISLHAKLLADGTLSGYVSTPSADMKWTATRAGDR